MQNTIINNYHIQSEIGRGGMAVVYVAHDNKFNTNVAIKVLNKEFVQNDNIRKRFLSEARNMFRMSHPNIIKVTDLIDEADTVAFVMEYIDGETLKEYLERKGKLNDEEIKNIFTQMLEAVGYVHEHNLVHRDIKPSNFMITPKGLIKLMDFGIAKNTDASSAEYTQTGTGVQMGTPMYMSPEQIKSSKEIGPASDLYTLGVVLWQMVSGRKPYDSNTLSTIEIHIKILQETLEPTGKYFDKIIFKALEKEPSSRYLNAISFKIALDTAEVIENDNTIREKQNTKTAITAPRFSQANKPLINHETEKTSFKKYLKAGLVFIFLTVSLCMFYLTENSNTIDEEVNNAADSARVADSEAAIIAHESKPLNGELTIEWVNITGGTFTMGSPKSESNRGNDELQHEVTLDGFKMSKYEITFDQYDAFCDATGRSKPADEGWGRGNRPVINVSWNDAKAFADWVGAKLPTEAQWEYACRAGASTPFNTGRCLGTDVANYDGNDRYQGCSFGIYQEKSKLVGSYKPNSWGLYDMHGNVWEWCSNWYGVYPSSPQNNPQGHSSGSNRVFRGGSWDSNAQNCRSANRIPSIPYYRNDNLGFRLVSPQERPNKSKSEIKSKKIKF